MDISIRFDNLSFLSFLKLVCRTKADLQILISMASIYSAARNANIKDLARMAELPCRPGLSSTGPRSLAFCHPKHSYETLEAHFSVFPQGIFVSENEGGIISCACAVRVEKEAIELPTAWFDGMEKGTPLSHHEQGTWLYVSRLAYTAGPGHASLSQELAPLLTALQQLAVKQQLSGVTIAARFPGFRDRSGTTSFQRSCIDDPRHQVRSGRHPIGVAHKTGFRHGTALPNYLGDDQHFSLMVWNRNAS
ncbi:hypothetical protein [uncultured Shimia sp.]|uniref:hypothetical protein n=1 Tax=uncultured Shimia sp. TaxID=573152 RepID=UPI0026206948|nr:hypothetical protein [uncultured Shimia sp.]